MSEVTERGYRSACDVVAVVGLILLLALLEHHFGETLYTIRPTGSWLKLRLQVFALSAIVYGMHKTGWSQLMGLKQLLGHNNSQQGLVVRGLYRWVRHPLCTGGMVLI